MGVFFGTFGIPKVTLESYARMQYEQDNTAVIAFYKTERLPKLEKEINAAIKKMNSESAAQLTKLIAEYNQGLDLVHGRNAAYMPHYGLEPTDTLPKVFQFVPAFLQSKQNDSQRFLHGPAKGLVKPTVEKVASFEDQPAFDISFLSKQLATLASSVQAESYRSPEDEFEIILYDSETVDEPYSDFLESGYLNTQHTSDTESDPVQTLYTEDESDEEQADSEVEIYFDENIPAGMFLVEFYDPIRDEIDALYLPHTPLNFPLVMSLIEDYLEIGGGVSLVFSEADKNNNLIIPIDPKDPDSDKPINPLLN